MFEVESANSLEKTNEIVRRFRKIGSRLFGCRLSITKKTVEDVTYEFKEIK